MQHNSFLIRLVFLWLVFAPVLTLAQMKPADEIQRQTEKVNAYVQEQILTRHIPCLSLAVARDGTIIYAKGYGMANLELSVPATEKTNFPIYSITKSFTAMAMMMLVEDGSISLEEPISKYLSDLPASWNPITIRQLLNHTGGIRSFGDSSEPPCKVGKEIYDSRADVLKEVSCLPLDFAPGERWVYGGTDYFLLGMLIEKLSGKTYEQFVRERIFAPMGMNETRMVSYTELVPNRADGYTWEKGAYRNTEPMDPIVNFPTPV